MINYFKIAYISIYMLLNICFRIMSEEHGYQRSGKKCREKFENLYKYYKKTKEGKAGRQDGKHYRFFRQLEALYGETSNAVSVPETHFAGNSSGLRFHSTAAGNTNPSHQPNHQEASYQLHNKPCDSLSLSNSSEFDTTSSDDNNDLIMDNDSISEKRNRKRRGSGRNWKAKIKDFIDSQMRKLMEKQEAWMEKLMGTLEQKEKERTSREDEWRKEEASRIDREHKFWAKERAWIEARDAALIDALHKLTGKEIKLSPDQNQINDHDNDEDDEDDDNDGGKMLSQLTPNEDETWPELEITRLIQLRSGMESRFQQGGGFSDEVLWEDIADKMARMGYDRSALVCKDKWESININYARKSAKELIIISKKRKENSRSSCGNYFPTNIESTSSLYDHGGGGGYCDMNEQGHASNNDGCSSPASNPNLSNAVHEGCFPFLMSEGENLWDVNYGLKLGKGGGPN